MTQVPALSQALEKSLNRVHRNMRRHFFAEYPLAYIRVSRSVLIAQDIIQAQRFQVVLMDVFEMTRDEAEILTVEMIEAADDDEYKCVKLLLTFEQAGKFLAHLRGLDLHTLAGEMSPIATSMDSDAQWRKTSNVKHLYNRQKKEED